MKDFTESASKSHLNQRVEFKSSYYLRRRRHASRDAEPERVSQLAAKHQLSAQEIKAGKRRGSIISADDFVISDIGLHRDLAEFQYDILGNEVFFRRLDGWWPDSLKRAGEFERLTAKEVAGSRAELAVPA